MTEFTIQHPWLLLLLFACLPTGMLMRYARRRKVSVVTKMGLSASIIAIERREKVRDILRLGAFVLMILAISRPGYNPKRYGISKQGRDVVFALDVSQSMLAEDAYPSRLEAAKQGIRDALDMFANERASLVLYAGSANILCPLTHDYDFLRYMLDQAGTRSVDFGGTTLQSAIEKTVDSVISDKRRHMHDLVVLTDGEDHEPILEKSADLLKEHGVGLLIVGLGDDRAGSRIPIIEEGKRQYLTYDNEPVMTRLNTRHLESLASQVHDGRYIEAGTDAFDLAQLYFDYVKDRPVSESDSSETYVVYQEAAFLLMVMTAVFLFFNVLVMRVPVRLNRHNADFSLVLICAVFLHLGDSAVLAAQGAEVQESSLPAIHTRDDVVRLFEAAITHQKAAQHESALMVYAHIQQSIKRGGRNNFVLSSDQYAQLSFNQGLCYLAQSMQIGTQDPEMALMVARQAQHAFLDAARADRNFKRASLRLDPTAALITQFEQAIEKEVKKQKEQQEKMQKLVERLQALLKAQIELQKKVPLPYRGVRNVKGRKNQLEPLKMPPTAIEDSLKYASSQLRLYEEGKDIELNMKTLDDELSQQLGMEAEGPVVSVLAAPRKLMTDAIKAQSQAAVLLKQWRSWQDARKQQQTAIEKIEAILKQLSNQGEGDSDDGEWDDEEEDWEDMEMNEQDSSMSSSMKGQGDFSQSQAMQPLPIPNYSAEDILMEEKGSMQFRQQQRAQNNQKGVKKDW